MLRSFVLIALAASTEVEAGWRQNYEGGTPFSNTQRVPLSTMFENALPRLDVEGLKRDIRSVMLGGGPSQWPADFKTYGSGGNFGPQFVRLAWHCSGTYRLSDGKGGCAGGRQRFEPERSWDDNANLDKTRALLAPIKAKYGDALSWGDLIVAAATVSMREMGAPLTKMCFGRIDEKDGSNSDALLENNAPCNSFQGNCQEPFGTGTTGLIYVNPEGPVIEAGGNPVPDPELSAADIRDVFGRMGDGDRDTVALIGGGHAFGKCHGACTDGPGLRPSEAFGRNLDMAYQGTCGEAPLRGKGPNTFTSGFEGPWTFTPTQWGNGFFKGLVNFQWEVHTGPGGHQQWRVVNGTGRARDLMRLTSDVALIHDPKYLDIVREFAADEDALGRAFDSAWFKLTHRGGQWSLSSFCDHGPMPQWVMDQNHHYMLDSDAVSV